MIIEKKWLHEMNRLIWGAECRPTDEVFFRWCQGFLFSVAEPSALVQYHGGPCAIITAVQARILSHILFKLKYESPNDLNEDEVLEVFHAALLEIFTVVSANNQFYICSSVPDNDTNLPDGAEGGESRPNDNTEEISNEDGAREEETRGAAGAETDTEVAVPRPHFNNFITNLSYQPVTSIEELAACLLSLIPEWQSQYGLLLFLYSVVLTRGVQNIRDSMADDQDQSLVDPVYGQGSQSLLNLLIFGVATPHVFDGDKDLGGIIMRGVPQQPMTGFLTLLESLRYIEVGWYFKNPQYPVWVLGSETHLTVLFSRLEGLIQHQAESDVLTRAERAFARLQDSGAEGFILVERLASLMEALELVTEKEYVDLIRSHLDPEELGIVLLNDFLKEFYAPEIELREKERAALREFPLFHYNGLVRPGEEESSIHYREGKARLYCPEDNQADLLSGESEVDSSPIRRVLQTKWPGVQLQWKDNVAPAI